MTTGFKPFCFCSALRGPRAVAGRVAPQRLCCLWGVLVRALVSVRGATGVSGRALATVAGAALLVEVRAPGRAVAGLRGGMAALFVEVRGAPGRSSGRQQQPRATVRRLLIASCLSECCRPNPKSPSNLFVLQLPPDRHTMLRFLVASCLLGLVCASPRSDMLAEADADANEAVRAELGGLTRTPVAEKMWKKIKKENHYCTSRHSLALPLSQALTRLALCPNTRPVP